MTTNESESPIALTLVDEDGTLWAVNTNILVQELAKAGWYSDYRGHERVICEPDATDEDPYSLLWSSVPTELVEEQIIEENWAGDTIDTHVPHLGEHCMLVSRGLHEALYAATLD